MPPKKDAKAEETKLPEGPAPFDDFMKHLDTIRDEIKKKQKDPVETFGRAETREFFNRGLRLGKDAELKDDEFTKQWDKIPKAKPVAGAPAAAAPAKGKDAKGPADDGQIVLQRHAQEAIVVEAQVRKLCEIPPPSLQDMINEPDICDVKAETDLNAFFGSGVLSDVELVNPHTNAVYK